MKRSRKRKVIPNPNRWFVELADILTVGGPISDIREEVEVELLSEGEEVTGSDEEEEEEAVGLTQTLWGREVKNPGRYED